MTEKRRSVCLPVWATVQAAVAATAPTGCDFETLVAYTLGTWVDFEWTLINLMNSLMLSGHSNEREEAERCLSDLQTLLSSRVFKDVSEFVVLTNRI